MATIRQKSFSFYNNLNEFDLTKLNDSSCIFICDPSNPTGIKLNDDELINLIEKINKMSYKIFQVVLRGRANFIVTSATIAGMLESTEDYRMEIGADRVTGDIGVIRTGTLQNRYAVYVDPYLPDGLMLVGYKGTNFLESGYVYAPYIPLVAVPTLFDPEDFTPRKGVMTRYAKQMVRPEFYGVIFVLDLDLF
jgi:hypothetical protein